MKKQNKTEFNKLVLDLKSQHIHSGVIPGLALVP